MKVRKGKHRFWPPSLGLFWGSEISRVVVFTPSCKYDLNGEDQLDVNKLFGVGYFPGHHKNSARFGWRWNIKNQRIELFAYLYRDEKRDIKYLDWVSINQPVRLSIEFHRKGWCAFRVNEAGWAYDIAVRRIGYKLGGYFGGNKPAPQDMVIEIEPV